MTFPNKILAAAIVLLSLGAPAAMADTLTVPGDFPTISAAAAAAAPGDTIVVARQPNVSYVENVVLATNDVSLTTYNAVIDPQGVGTALTISGDRVKVVGFTIRNSINFGIAVTGDDVSITNVTVASCVGTGISILADGANVSGCRVRHCSGSGIEYGATGVLGSGTFARNVLELNTDSGMLLSGDRLNVTYNAVTSNGGDGIPILNGGFVGLAPSAVNGNVVMSNNRNGIMVLDPGAGPMTIASNRIGLNGRNGIELNLGAGVNIQRNYIQGNSRAGILLEDTASASVVGNNVRSNARHGIEVTNNGPGGHLIARNYTFYNGRDGLHVQGSSNAMLDNFIFNNLGDGVDVVGDGPTLGNDVSNNVAFRNGHEGIDNSGIATRITLNRSAGNGSGGNGPDIAGAGNGGIGTLGVFKLNITGDDTSDMAIAAATSQVVDID